MLIFPVEVIDLIILSLRASRREPSCLPAHTFERCTAAMLTPRGSLVDISYSARIPRNAPISRWRLVTLTSETSTRRMTCLSFPILSHRCTFPLDRNMIAVLFARSQRTLRSCTSPQCLIVALVAFLRALRSWSGRNAARLGI